MNDLATRPSSPRKSAVSSGIDHITKAARVVSFDVADNSLPIETASKDHKEEALNRTGSDNSGVLHHRTDTQFADQNPSLDDTGSIGEQEFEKKPISRRPSAHSQSIHKHSIILRPNAHSGLPRGEQSFLSSIKKSFGYEGDATGDVLQRYKARIEDLEHGYAKRDKSNRRLRREVSDLANDNNEMQRQLEKQETQIRAMQEKCLDELEGKGFLEAEDDERIRQKVQSLMGRLRLWAKEHAVARKRQIKLADLPLVDELYRSNMTSAASEASDDLPSPENNSPAPGLVLSAELSRFLTQWIFQQPFFCLNTGLFTSSEACGVPQAFDSVYSAAQLQDPRTAHIWRSQTLQMVDPPEYGSGALNGNYLESVRRKEEYYKFSTITFDSSSARVLYRPSDGSQRQKELYNIIRTAGELFASLWKQKVFIASWGLEKFQFKKFSSASNEMMAHPAHNLEDGDDRLDGCRVRMVVHPAIVAYGNEEGHNYHEYKVWAKASVWVA